MYIDILFYLRMARAVFEGTNMVNAKGSNAKISAVRSLADICFLHVPIRLIRCIIVSVCPLVF